MDRRLFSRLIIYFLLFFPSMNVFSTEENFLLINGTTSKIVHELGPHIHERVTPCSTFKIVLSLMGYDAGILKDEKTPIWFFQEGYDDFLTSWKEPQSPHSWMKSSCVWYSRVLATKLEIENIHHYLAMLEYGNQDMSGGLTKAWISSSLKISPKEQVDFIQKMVQEKLSISNSAMQMTKVLLFVSELPEGWKLFGKTGWGSIIEQNQKISEVGWFIGWAEKDQIFFPFAYSIRDEKINLAQRIPRVKQLLAESNAVYKSNKDTALHIMP
ncbi:penicillin-binding transpeptidase domain-containing protein [Parachlamydia sp.]